MEIALCVLYAIAGILMVIAMLFTLADVVMALRQKRRKNALLDRLETAAEAIEEAIASDFAESDERVILVSDKDLFEKILTMKDFEDDGK